MKKLLPIIFSTFLLFSSVGVASASSVVPQEVEESSNVAVSQDEINNLYIDQLDRLADYVKSNNHEDVSKSVSDFLSQDTLKNNDELKTYFNQKSKKLNILSQKPKEEVALKSIEIDAKTILTTYDDGTLSITKTTMEPVSNSTLATYTKWGQSTKDYYSIVGMKLFTIAVGIECYCDGTKASPTGIDKGFYERGFLSVWQVSDWKFEKQAFYQTDYGAYVQGNFHYGFEVEGVGIVIQDKFIKHQVIIHKDCSVSTSNNF
ncbi:hypothetical protein J23TS9_01610 [Paenibacillus sp. J23TS9]|uniref:hypothetical protein n=1 Tax=Paenibacillus sp. J23TS9 TaxID=2807193 RepID=UPI001B17190A|nr:hypothetical protein [Paenibacillus sp. J23TS9]GIP25031.1 hypothetical protein J23TS9_01610 [Paenibacillus sp. J23TS9]